MKYCGKCNKPINIIEKIISENETERIHEVTEQCDNCKIIYKKYNKKVIKPKAARQDSALSIWAVVLSLFGITSFIAFILALVDLGINDKKKRHLGSWVALAFCVLYLFVGGGIFLGTSSSHNHSNKENSSESQVVISEEDYKSSCKEYDYKEVLRNPSQYIGEKIVITAEIYGSFSYDTLTTTERYYFCYTETEPGNGYFWGNEYAVFDCRINDDTKLLESDVVKIYGEIIQPQKEFYHIISSNDVFCIDMKYVEIIE